MFISSQEKYNFAIITEHCCDDEAAEFEASLKKLDFIHNYEVKFERQRIALFEWFDVIFSFIILICLEISKFGFTNQYFDISRCFQFLLHQLAKSLVILE